MRRGDMAVLAVLLAAGSAFFIYWNTHRQESGKAVAGSTYATIKLDGKLYRTVALTKETQDIEIQTKRGYDLLRISDYGIEVIKSDCPEKICMTYGHIHNPGQMIICLPNRMVVEVVGNAGADNGTDAMVT